LSKLFDDIKRAAMDRLARPGRPPPAADAPVEPRPDHSPPTTSAGLNKTAHTGNDSVLIQALKRATADGLRHPGDGYAAPASPSNAEADTIAEAERASTRNAHRRTDEARRAMETARARLDAEHVAIQLATERLQAERLAEAAARITAEVEAEQAAVEQAKRRALAEQRAADEAVTLHRAEQREAAHRATVRASGSRATVQLSWPLAAAGATLALILGIAIGASERAQPPATTPASRAARDSTTPAMPEKLQLRLDDDVDRFGSRPGK